MRIGKEVGANKGEMNEEAVYIRRSLPSRWPPY